MQVDVCITLWYDVSLHFHIWSLIGKELVLGLVFFFLLEFTKETLSKGFSLCA